MDDCVIERWSVRIVRSGTVGVEGNGGRKEKKERAIRFVRVVPVPVPVVGGD